MKRKTRCLTAGKDFIDGLLTADQLQRGIKLLFIAIEDKVYRITSAFYIEEWLMGNNSFDAVAAFWPEE
jgi:hypothetical protein